MSKNEAIRSAEMGAQFGVLRAITVIIICFLVILVLLWRGDYWYAIPVGLLLIFAIYWMIRMNRLSEAYEQERTRTAAEEEKKD